ncbi:hypothetical protein J2X76_003287 [Neorhizobium sp. 2083]|uniref:hypothetical protein n=1 Tax=Neorhizobium sp. 2083 TaxID=2817762 RepID=UPI002863482E|nr:hypothetical protein [Neorhizobium sp. 2083]MDR6818110.1 hypothetical protein [Neorhizobium sp. 2083]
MDSSVGKRDVFSVFSNTMMYSPPVNTVIRRFLAFARTSAASISSKCRMLTARSCVQIPVQLRPGVSVFRDYDAKLPGFGIFSAVTVFPYAAGFSGTITMHADPVSICHGGVPPGLYDTTVGSRRREVKQLTLPEV